MFINKLWKTGQISTNTSFYPVFPSFFNLAMWIFSEAVKITHIQTVNNPDFGGKGGLAASKNVDARAVNRFGGGRFYPIVELIKSYTMRF